MTSESEASASDLKRRVVDLEHQRSRTLQDGNKRCSELESQVAHLRMLLEHNEAVRRQTDLKAATVQSEAESQAAKQSAGYLALQRSRQDLEARLAAEASRAAEFEVGLRKLHGEHEERVTHFLSVLQQRETDLVSARQQCSEALAAKSAMENDLAEKTSLATSLQARVDRFAGENLTQRETVMKQLEQLEATVGQNQDLNSRTKHQSAEIAELREKIEAERSSHLQSKFNCEVVQLRLKDVETSVKAERSARNEAALNSDLLVDQLKDARERLAEEQSTVLSLSHQLAEHTAASELAEKSLKEKLQTAEKAERHVSAQLNRARTDGSGAAREKDRAEASAVQLNSRLVTLAQQVDTAVLRSQATLSKRRSSRGKKVESRYKDSVTAEDIEGLVGSLTAAVSGYEDKISKLSAAVSLLDSKLKVATEQCGGYQRTQVENEQALQGANSKVKDLESALRSKASRLTDKDRELGQCGGQVESLQQLLEEQRQRLERTKEDQTQQARKIQEADETRNQRLHALCLQLSSITCQDSATPLSPDGPLTWKKVVSCLERDIGRAQGRVKSCEDKVKRLEALLQRKEEDIKRLHGLHEESLEKVSAATTARELAWQQQRQSQEAHMAELMKEVEGKIQEAHRILFNTEAERDAMKEERDRRQRELAASRQRAEELNGQCLSLRSASALLAGALWPLCVRLHVLSQAMAVVSCHARHMDTSVSLATHLASAVSEELTSDGSGSSESASSRHRRHRRPAAEAGATRTPVTTGRHPRGLHPLLRFRKSAVAVIAFNRFRRLLRFSSSLCIVRDCPAGLNQRLPVWVCGPSGSDDASFPSPGTALYRQHRLQKHTDWVQFVRSADFLSKMTASSDQLCALLCDTAGVQRGRKPSTTLQLCARGQLSAVLQSLDGNFAGASLWSFDADSQWSTVHVLRDGLRQCMARATKSPSPKFYVYEQHVAAMSTIHQHVINLANQLQKAEIQSHRHQQKVIELQQALKNANQQFSLTSKRLLSAERKATNLVPVERFDSVCTELKAGLEREQQQQVELGQQREALLQGKRKLEALQAERRRLDTTLQQSIQDLKDGKKAVHSTEDSLASARQQRNTLQQQEVNLRGRLAQLQDSLLTVNREKSTLLAYLEAVGAAMEKVRGTDLSGEEAAKVLKSALRSSRDKLQDGGDFAKCKTALTDMVDVLLTLAAKLDTCERALALNVSHVKTLRRELSSACRRQLSEAAVQLAESVVTDTENGYGEVDLTRLQRFLAAPSRSRGESQRVAPLRGEVDTGHPAVQFSMQHHGKAATGGAEVSGEHPNVQGLGADLSARLSAAIQSS